MRRRSAYWIATSAVLTLMMPPLWSQNCSDPAPPVIIGISVNPSPSVYGQSVVVSVTVTPLMGCPVATGSVQLTVDNSSFGSPIALDANSGNATINIPDAANNIPSPVIVFPSAGNHTVGVAYSGGIGIFNYPAQGANNNQILITVNKAGSITNLSAASNGTSLTAAVSAAPPGSGSPTGSVQFSNGSTPLGSANVSGGQATIAVNGLVGTITASYSGDANFTGSNAVRMFGPPPSSALTISASVDPSTIGQSVTFTATLTVANGDGLPSGTIQFSVDGTKIPGPPAQVSGGQASFTTSTLTVGSHTISANYSGDTQYPAASNSRGQAVSPIGSVLTLTSSPSAPQSGQPVTLTVQIGPQPPAGIPGPTGQVTVSEGTNQLGVGNVSSAKAVIQLGTLADGTHQLVAVYGGDTDWSSARGTITVAVNVVISPLTIVTTSLPEATVGVAYTAPAMSATGGVPPLQWTIVQSNPAGSGIVMASDGTFSGTPQTAGQFTLTVQVSDAQNTKVNKQFTLQVAATALTITTPSLPGGTTGSPYSVTVAASGGTGGNRFSGSLPANLTIDPASGLISGTPAVTGTVAITVNVKDSAGATASKTYNVVFALPPPVPPVTISGVGNTGPAQQPMLQVNLGASYPLPIDGTLILTFVADKGGDNPEVQFAKSDCQPAPRCVTFTIPANSSSATIPNPQFQTGTVAGKITITANLKVPNPPSPPPTEVIRINAAPPTISCTASRSATGFTVVCTGFSTTLDMTNAIFQFTGANLATTSITIPVGTLFGNYYQTATPGATGSQFVYTQPFTVTGNTAAVTSVSVTMQNSNGTSQAATATIQ